MSNQTTKLIDVIIMVIIGVFILGMAYIQDTDRLVEHNKYENKQLRD